MINFDAMRANQWRERCEALQRQLDALKPKNPGVQNLHALVLYFPTAEALKEAQDELLANFPNLKAEPLL